MWSHHNNFILFFQRSYHTAKQGNTPVSTKVKVTRTSNQYELRTLESSHETSIAQPPITCSEHPYLTLKSSAPKSIHL